MEPHAISHVRVDSAHYAKVCIGRFRFSPEQSEALALLHLEPSRSASRQGMCAIICTPSIK